MRDIRYSWKDGLNSVGMSSEVELPQFRVLGHRQRATEINLTTGTQIKHTSKTQNQPFKFTHTKKSLSLVTFLINTRNSYDFVFCTLIN